MTAIRADSSRKKADVDRVVEIERLAALSRIDYEVARSDAAKQLSMRTSALDREVEKKRRALGLKTGEQEDNGQGRAIKIEDPLLWYEPAIGDHLAESLAAAAKTYVVVSDEVADTFALWVLQTWLVGTFYISPRLAITSPTKGCGKTTLLRLLNRVVRRPKRAGSISPAALFRVVEQFQPTILLDETEKYIDQGSDLHALLNEGHCKGGTVLRVLGEKLELRQFAVFGAVAFARNGRLPDDLQQRSIVIEMQRRLPGELLTELREGPNPSLERMAQQCARWADDNAEDVASRDPDMGELINRGADNWRPLYALAEVIGADWPVRIRKGAAALALRESEATSILLLIDIKAMFEDRATDRLSSVDICAALNVMEGRPWADWRVTKGASAKPLSPNQLARLLKPFGVAPDNMRVGEHILKGYHRHQFEELWTRYLPLEGFEPLHRYNADGIDTSSTFQTATPNRYVAVQSATPEGNVAVQTCEKPANDVHCSGVAVGNGKKAPLARVCEQCGQRERPDDPILACWVDGEEHQLHRGCQRAWLTRQRSPSIGHGGTVAQPSFR